MSEKKSGFDVWWNSPKVKRITGAAYSIGAAIVILGAMFKILHLPLASYILGAGMTTEAILFALGAFDKPHKEFAWDKVFNFTANEKMNGSLSMAAGNGYDMRKPEVLDDNDVVGLSEGIKKLSETARQLNTLADVAHPTDNFIKTMNAASKATDDYIKIQSVLNTSTQKLAVSYDGIGNESDSIVKNTKQYAERVEDVNKKLSSINSLYEIQLKNINAQSENLNTQSEQLRIVSEELDSMVGGIQQINSSAKAIATETEKYKEGTAQLAKQIAALNQVYGNMLNSLS